MDNLPVPVQDTRFNETPLSTEETTGIDSPSMGLHLHYTKEPENKMPIDHGRSNCEPSYLEPRIRGIDVNKGKSKIVDIYLNDNSSMSSQQDSDFSKSIRQGDQSSMSYMLIKSKDGTTPQLLEDDLSREVDGTTELSGLEKNAKEAFIPNGDILGHNEVSNMCSTTDNRDRNADTLNPDDIYTDACTIIAPNKQQDGGNTCEDRTIDSEDKRSADRGGNIKEPLYLTPSSKEADVQEKRDNVFNDSSPNDSSSMGLPLQDSNVTNLISSDNNSSMILKSEDSSTVRNDENIFVSEGQRSNISVAEVGESEPNDDFGYESTREICYSHEFVKGLSATNQTVRTDSSINNDEGTNIKASNISAWSKVQGGGDVDTKEPENKKSVDHGKSNNEPSYLEPQPVEDGSTAAYEENKNSAEVQRSNNRTTELFEPGHDGNVDSKPNDDTDTSLAASPTGRNASNVKIGSKIDDSTITTSNKLETGDSAIKGGREMDFIQCDSSTNAVIDQEYEMSIDHARSNNEFSCQQRKPVNKGNTIDVNSPNVSSSAPEVLTPLDLPTESSTSIISQPEGSTTSRHAAEFTRSKNHRKKNSRPNDDNQARNRVTGANTTDGNASIDVGRKKTTNISKTNSGPSSEVYTGRRRRNHNFKSDVFPINHKPGDKTSSGDGGKKNVLSCLKPKSHHQSQTIEKNSNLSVTTGSTSFHPLDNVSTSETRPHKKSCNGIRLFRKAFSFDVPWKYIFLLVFLMKPILVQASPVTALWRQFSFCKMDISLMNQTLAIKNMEKRHSPGCTFSFTSLPFFHNCSESGNLVFAENETCVEMLTEDPRTEDWRLEYGNTLNGHALHATRGGLLNEQSVMQKISEYNNSQDILADKNQTKKQSQDKDGNETKDENKTKDRNKTMLIGIFVTLALIGLIGALFVLLWKRCPKLQSWVKSSRRPGTNNDPEPGPNRNSNTDPSAEPLTTAPHENGHINREDHYDEESQGLNAESSEQPVPNNSETSV